MKFILVLIAFLAGCCLLDSKFMLPAPSKGDFFSTPGIATPDIIPDSIIPEVTTYYIKTHIVIEGQPVRIQDMAGVKDTEMIWWAKDLNDIKNELKNAEKIYSEVAVKFIITAITYKEYNPDIVEHWIKANINKNILTIHYILPNAFSSKYDGYSTAPWEKINRGISIHYLADEWTLAHEIGHYFGLLHPFENDLLQDTPKQDVKFCSGKECATANCHNIMSYCIHTPKTITQGQIDRFKRFLRANRINHCVPKHTDITLNGSKFPISTKPNVTFQIKVDKNGVSTTINEE